MDLRLTANPAHISRNTALQLTGSKSETNRLLLLQSLYPGILLENASDSDDSSAMRQAVLSNSDVIDVHHAGTAMRFLTAYFSILEGRTVTITGSARMQQRPIGILVDALRSLGARIEYMANDGFPPLRIVGTKLTKSSVELDAGVSSQYISALLLIAPMLENGLELMLNGNITSIPYIKMTLSLLDQVGVRTSFSGNVISVRPMAKLAGPVTITVESDWSSASYFYSIVALSEIGSQVVLSHYKQNSFQGDAALADIYKVFGVETKFETHAISLRKSENCQVSVVNCQLNDTPDIAQTVAVTAFGLGVGCSLTGLHTLRIKETDRLQALKTELEKLGGSVEITDDSLSFGPTSKIRENTAIDTYDDHRMAMAFAPLALKTAIVINEAQVVSKSYPSFWDDLEKTGFQIEEL